MGYIHEPVKDWNIIYVIKRPDDDKHDPGKILGKDTMKTLTELRAYFREHKRYGEVVGYVIVKNRTPGFNDYMITGHLEFEWWDQISYVHKTFFNVFDFVSFLEEYPPLAKAVGYVKKVK